MDRKASLFRQGRRPGDPCAFVFIEAGLQCFDLVFEFAQARPAFARKFACRCPRDPRQEPAEEQAGADTQKNKDEKRPRHDEPERPEIKLGDAPVVHGEDHQHDRKGKGNQPSKTGHGNTLGFAIRGQSLTRRNCERRKTAFKREVTPNTETNQVV